MGMYDTLYVENPDMLMLSEDEAKLITPETEWQTKSLDKVLTEVYLTADGRLEVNEFEYEEVPREERPYPDDDGILGLCGSWRRVDERRLERYFHGYLGFYTSIAGKWIEFVGKFTDGKLVKLDRVDVE